MTGLFEVLAGSVLRVRCHDELAVWEPYSPSGESEGFLAVMVVLFGQGRGRGCPLLRSCCLTLSPSRQESFQGKRGSLPAEASFSGKSLFKGRGGASFVLDGPPSSNAGHFWLTSCRLRQLVEASANLPDGGDAACRDG